MGVLEEKLAAARKPRAIHTFTFPTKIAADVRTISFKELTAEDELVSSKRAGQDAFRIIYERVRESLVEADGKPISLSDGTADAVWAGLPPPARELAIAAFQSIHSAPEDTAKDFLASQSVRVD